MKNLVKMTSMTTVAALSMSTLVFATSPQNPADLVSPENPLIIIDETTSEELVPVRSIGEEYGFDVDWYGNTKTTVLTKAGHEYATEIGVSLYEINHDIVGLGTPARLIDGTTYVPVSFAYAIDEDLNGTTEITDGGNGGGYGGGDITEGGGNGGGLEPDDGFDFDNPNIDNGYTINDHADFDYNNPDIDNGYNVDVNDDGYVDYTTLPEYINE